VEGGFGKLADRVVSGANCGEDQGHLSSSIARLLTKVATGGTAKVGGVLGAEEKSTHDQVCWICHESLVYRPEAAGV
jgi:hypothetical protein